MRSLASGFALEKSRAFLNCMAQGASVSAKRAALTDARLPMGLGWTGLIVVEAFELLSWCCMATPHVACHLSLWDASFGAQGRVALFIGTFRKTSAPLKAQRYSGAGARLGI